MTVHRLPSELRWIGFDLDDTLHYFKRASSRAAEAVLGEIERQFGIGVSDLDDAYGEILLAAQRSHFAERKTSPEYRADRFRALLGGFDCDRPSQARRSRRSCSPRRCSPSSAPSGRADGQTPNPFDPAG